MSARAHWQAGLVMMKLIMISSLHIVLFEVLLRTSTVTKILRTPSPSVILKVGI